VLRAVTEMGEFFNSLTTPPVRPLDANAGQQPGLRRHEWWLYQIGGPRSIQLALKLQFSGSWRPPKSGVPRHLYFGLSQSTRSCEDRIVQAGKIRILVVDHNPLLSEGLSLLIQLQPDMELVDVVASGKQAVQSFTEQRPDVTLMDLDLPSGAGITAIREILKIDAAACVIGLFTYEGDVSHARALRAGARSCFNQRPLE
jgi:CheY-like chemotaxis protein